MTGVLYRLARFCIRRRFVVSRLARGDHRARRRLPPAWRKHQRQPVAARAPTASSATDTLARSFPDQANGTSPIVLHAHSGKLTEPKYSTAINQAAAAVAKNPNVASVSAR